METIVALGVELCPTCDHWCDAFACRCGAKVTAHRACGNDGCSHCDEAWLGCERVGWQCDACGHPACSGCCTVIHPDVICNPCAESGGDGPRYVLIDRA